MLEKNVRIAAGILALLGLFALGAQLPITIEGFAKTGGSTLGGVWRFFGYFTIITNCVCVFVMGLAAFNKLRNPNWLSAVTSYMVILCLVYWVLLSKNNHETGWRYFVDCLLHYVLPVGTLVAWVVTFPKYNLTWIQPVTWMAYPVSYSVYSMVRGAFEGWYPYFFLDAGKYGYAKVFINILGLATLFLVAGLLLVALGRFLSRSHAPKVLQAP
jgi:hypothetical protein